MNKTVGKAACTHAVRIGHADCKHCSVRGIVLFSDLQEADLDLILSPIDRFMFPVQSTLYRLGEEAPCVYTLRRGLVKLVQYLPNGTPRIVRLLRAGDVAGLEILINGSYHHTAVALQETEACRVPLEVIRKLNQDRPRLSRQILQRWLKGMDEADNFIALLSTGPTRARVARLLLYLAGTADHCLMLGREDMGAVLGIRTESASRAIAGFRREGLVEPRNGLFHCDIAGLREIAER